MLNQLTPQKVRKFQARVGPPDENKCWPWLGAKDIDGYSRLPFSDDKLKLAHRFSYLLYKGEIPGGYHVDHVAALGCKRRDCVNPDHLETVPPAENVHRSACPAAINKRKTHCTKGHALVGHNLIIRHKEGKRRCRECARKNARERAQEERSTQKYLQTIAKKEVN